MRASKKLIKNVLILLFWLVLWHVGASIANRGLVISIPTPITTISALVGFLSQKSFYMAVFGSVARIAVGFAVSVILGGMCAVLSYRYRMFKELAMPLLHIIRAVPVAAFIILVYLWLEEGSIPIFIAFLMVFPLVWGNTEAGLNAIDTSLVEMAQIMELPKRKIFSKIIFPAVMPSFSAALTTGLGFAWKSGVAAEVICRTNGSIGNMLWASKTSIEYNEVFAITAVIVVLSVVLEKVMKVLLWRYNVDKA